MISMMNKNDINVFDNFFFDKLFDMFINLLL